MLSRPITRKDALLALLVVSLLVSFTGIAQGQGLPALLAGPQAAPAAVEVPSGAVMFFNTTSCPSGWSELAAAQGRYLVARPAGGTVGLSIGSALANGENRAVGQHTHTVNDPSHGHNVYDTGHTHTLYDPGHAHIVTDPGHVHALPAFYYAGTPDSFEFWALGGISGHRFQTFSISTTLTTTTGVSLNNATTNITVNSASGGVLVDSATTGISINNTGSAGTNAPYLQLLACVKS